MALHKWQARSTKQTEKQRTNDRAGHKQQRSCLPCASVGYVWHKASSTPALTCHVQGNQNAGLPCLLLESQGTQARTCACECTHKQVCPPKIHLTKGNTLLLACLHTQVDVQPCRWSAWPKDSAPTSKPSLDSPAHKFRTAHRPHSRASGLKSSS